MNNIQMERAQIERDTEQNSDEKKTPKLVLNAEDLWRKRKYSQCNRLTRGDFNVKNYQQDLKCWVIRNNGLACKLKPANIGDFCAVDKEFCDLSKQIQGVPSSLEVLCLDVVVTFNHLACILCQNLCIAGTNGYIKGCLTGVEQKLTYCVGRVIEFLGCTQKETQPLQLQNMCLEILENVRLRSDAVLAILGLHLTFDCVVYYLLNRMPSTALELINAFKSILPDQSCFLPNTFNPSNIDLHLILSDDSKNFEYQEIPLSLNTAVLQDLYLCALLASGDYTTCLEEFKTTSLDVKRLEFAYFKAFMLFRQGRVSECVELCTNIKDVSSDLQHYWFNIFGCCLYKQKRNQTAVQVLNETLNKENATLLSLYNMSLIYRRCSQDSEFECLQALLDTLKGGKSQSENGAFNRAVAVCGLNIMSKIYYPGIHLPHVLYLIGKRCLELEKYKNAVANFKELIPMLQKWEGVGQWQGFSTDIETPPLRVVYVELAYCLLNSKQFAECEIYCDILLNSRAQSNINIPRQRCESNAVLSDSLGTPDNNLKAKRKRETVELGFNNVQDKLCVLMFKADAFANECKYKEALVCFNEVVELCQNYFSVHNSEEQRTKVPKADKSQSVADLSTCLVETILTHAYLNKASILMVLMNVTHAIHMSRLAIQLNPNFEPAFYNHTLILLQGKRWKEACQAWLPRRGLTPDRNKLAETLKTYSKHFCKLGTDCDPKVEVQQRGLSETDKLRLDVHLLKILKNKTEFCFNL